MTESFASDNPLDLGRRRFIRHAADVPIQVRALSGQPPRRQPAVDVSEGGLSFISEDEIPVGTTAEIRIDEVEPAFEAHARVVWTRAEENCYCIGVQFIDARDAFRARMVQQVCAIQTYRRRVLEEEGRVLSREAAAREWVSKYAGRFPRYDE